MKKKRSPLLLLALLAVLSLVAAACGDDDEGSDTTTGGSGSTTTAEGSGSEIPDGPTITIGAQDFSESAILAQVYGQALEAAGYTVAYQSLGGYRDLQMPAFENGTINFAPEYAASMLEFLNEQAGEATSDAAETTELLNERLAELGLRALAPTSAVDTNAFVITRATAEANDIATLSDLAEKGQEFTLGAPADCETNPFCLPGLRDVYGLDLSAGFTSLGSGQPIVGALLNDAIDVGVLFSTNPSIVVEDLVLLEDDQQMLAADNVVPVLTEDLLEVYGQDLANLVDQIGKSLTTANLTELVRQVDIDKRDADEVATEFLEEEGLL